MPTVALLLHVFGVFMPLFSGVFFGLLMWLSCFLFLSSGLTHLVIVALLLCDFWLDIKM